MGKMILKKEKFRGIIPLIWKTYYKAIVIKTVWSGKRESYWSMEQNRAARNRVKWIWPINFWERCKASQWRMNSYFNDFALVALEQLNINTHKMTLDLNLTSFIKINSEWEKKKNSEWIKDLNVWPYIVGGSLYELRLSRTLRQDAKTW